MGDEAASPSSLMPLETFLRGMETTRPQAAGGEANDLETFLRGMETCNSF